MRPLPPLGSRPSLCLLLAVVDSGAAVGALLLLDNRVRIGALERKSADANARRPLQRQMFACSQHLTGAALPWDLTAP